MASSLDQSGGPTPAKIILKQSTGMSLNDRFTMLNSKPVRSQPSTAAAQPSSGQLRLQRAQVVRSAQQQAREHTLMGRRLPPTSPVAPSSSLQSARLKEPSVKSRLGLSSASAVKQRLGSASAPYSARERVLPPPSQPLSVRQIPRFRPTRPPLRERLGSAPGVRRGAPAQRRNAGGAESAGRRVLSGRGPRGRARGAAAASYGGFGAGAARGQRRRGGLTGRNGEADKQVGQALSKDELDKQLDAYMSKSKAQLGAQLDTYMAQASSNANAMQL